MKQFLKRNEEKIFIICLLWLLSSFLLAFIAIGLKDLISPFVGKLFVIYLVFSMATSILFPFVVMDFKEERRK